MNVMLFNRLWICCVKHKRKWDTRWFPRGTGYINDKPSIYWILIWRIQLMWFTNNGRPNGPIIYSLRKGIKRNYVD